MTFGMFLSKFFPRWVNYVYSKVLFYGKWERCPVCHRHFGYHENGPADLGIYNPDSTWFKELFIPVCPKCSRHRRDEIFEKNEAIREKNSISKERLECDFNRFCAYRD